jgi:hypothetical protein
MEKTEYRLSGRLHWAGGAEAHTSPPKTAIQPRHHRNLGSEKWGRYLRRVRRKITSGVGKSLLSAAGASATDLDQIFTAVRQQEPVEPSEAGAAPEQLALHTLPAINHDAATPAPDGCGQLKAPWPKFRGLSVVVANCHGALKQSIDENHLPLRDLPSRVGDTAPSGRFPGRSDGVRIAAAIRTGADGRELATARCLLSSEQGHQSRFLILPLPY